MIHRAVNTYAVWIDTTRVGLAGHSYGGGSTVWIGKQVFDPNGDNWGTNGRFIMMFAPWYPFLITDTELQNYPPGVKLVVVQSYDDFSHEPAYTYYTDPRILRAMYQLIDIPDSDKDYITVFSDTVPSHQYVYNNHTFTYEANHFISYTDLVDGYNNPYDRLDVYVMNRLMHAMTAYVFEGDTAAKNVILGNGSTAQTNMDILPDLAVTDYYVCHRPESEFQYKCTASAGTWSDPSIWKLYDYCTDSDNDGVIDNLGVEAHRPVRFTLYPNPATGFVHLDFDRRVDNFDVKIISAGGKTVWSAHNPNLHIIDTRGWAPGLYFVKIYFENQVAISKLIVE
jgi:hypothetical protein